MFFKKSLNSTINCLKLVRVDTPASVRWGWSITKSRGPSLRGMMRPRRKYREAISWTRKSYWGILDNLSL